MLKEQVHRQIWAKTQTQIPEQNNQQKTNKKKTNRTHQPPPSDKENQQSMTMILIMVIDPGNGCNQKGFCAKTKKKGGAGFHRALVPLTGPSVPVTGPSLPLTRALSNCLIVGHSPGFNCIGPRGASKNIGLGRT